MSQALSTKHFFNTRFDKGSLNVVTQQKIISPIMFTGDQMKT
jgi:hypothetical protein